ncbi:MAG: SLC13 family permease [Anaerolineae bacterium]|nr:SLC13 family permease [Anaerolineae bacterium]
MDIQVALVLGTVVAALVLFSIEKIPVDVTALGILLFLIITGVLPAEQAFMGFGSDVVIMMLGLLILVAALTRTGVTDIVGRVLLTRSEASAQEILLVIMAIAALVGAFMSNTTATAFFLPIVITVARRMETSPARFLMPLAFASILASSISLISTSTNIVVSGLIQDLGLAPIGMFELAPVGIPIAVVGIAYMFLLGRHLVPDRIPHEEIEQISTRLYFTEILIPAQSPLVGETLRTSALGSEMDLKVLRIVRDGRRLLVPRATTRLEEDDVLLVEGTRQSILDVKEEASVEIKADVKFPSEEIDVEEMGLTEVMVLPNSPLAGRTLRGLDFRDRYGLQVLAINRQGETLSRKMSHVRLQVGDVLVVQGREARIDALERQDLFRRLSLPGVSLKRRDRAPVALAIFGGAVLAGTLKVLSLPVAMLLGAVVAFATRCITPEEAYSQVRWQVLILIAAMLGLGVAMETTGTAAFLASQIVQVVGASDVVWLLSAFFALTVLLTQPMSNQAAAAVVLPVAIRTAEHLGLNPRSFAMMVALAASCSYLTPLEPACLLVYGPGRYRFFDFLKVGALPTVLIYVLCILLVPVFWPV